MRMQRRDAAGSGEYTRFSGRLVCNPDRPGVYSVRLSLNASGTRMNGTVWGCRMKILRVANDLYPWVVGGLPIHIHEMSKMQAASGHDVTVCTSRKNGEAMDEWLEGYRIVRYPNMNVIGNAISLSLLFRLGKMAGDFDLVHAHSHLFFSTNLCAYLRRKGNTPLVITNHGLISQRAPLWAQKIYIPTVARWTLKSADRVISYSDEERGELVRLGVDPERIRVIHNGINTDVFSPDSENSSKKQILWIGRYMPGKGAEYLIEAFARLVGEDPELHLLMIGDGPFREKIANRIRELDLTDAVTLSTFVPNTELPAVYRNSSVFVLPSIYEGFPRTILEAMACGVPVVCSRLPQLVDVVNGAGLTIPVRDAGAIASAVSAILADPAMARKMGETGRSRVNEHFSWKDTVMRTTQLFEELT
jgi:glycosyltransferase involved in cell wall biosynthesis